MYINCKTFIYENENKKMLKVLLHQVSEKCNLIKFIIFVHVAQKNTVKKFLLHFVVQVDKFYCNNTQRQERKLN